MSDKRTDDATLIAAVRILSRMDRDLDRDGVIPACLAEAATRLEELVQERRSISTLLGKVESLEADNERLREERKTWCTVDGYPGKFEMQPLPPGPEGHG